MLRALLVPLYLLQSILLVMTSPRILTKCIFPLALGLTVFAVAVVLGVLYREDIANLLYHFEASWIQAGFEWILSFFILILSAFIAYFATSIIGSFSYESITLEIMKLNELPAGLDESTYALALIRGAVHEIYKLIFIGVLSLAAIIPILAPAALPISFFLIAFEYFDLPLQLQGHEFSYRLKIITRHLPEVLILGAITTALFLIPLGALVFTPLLHATAVRSLSKWEIRPITT